MYPRTIFVWLHPTYKANHTNLHIKFTNTSSVTISGSLWGNLSPVLLSLGLAGEGNLLFSFCFELHPVDQEVRTLLGPTVMRWHWNHHATSKVPIETKITDPTDNPLCYQCPHKFHQTTILVLTPFSVDCAF